MRSSTDVTLPRSVVPVFPECCVVCQQQTNATAKIVQHSQNPLVTLFAPFMLLFGWSRVAFPLCPKCWMKFYLQRWGRTILCWTILGIAVVVVMPYFRDWNPTTRKLAVVAICIGIAMPYFLFEVFFPRAFETTAFSRTTTYEFRSRQLGLEFYALNKAKHPYSRIDITLGND